MTKFFSPKPADIGAAAETVEALTFPIDYNDGTAVDPTAGLLFTTQQQVDRFLVANSTSNFKHLQAVWDSLPTIISKDITINVAAGVQRPRSGDTGGVSFDLGGKQLVLANVLINGSVPSTWPALPGFGGLTVLSVSLAAGDPSITFSGTPFTGQDLRGRYLVADTGQVLVCHDNDASTLRVLTNPSPTPTTITVTSSPATIWRNSLTDASGSALNAFCMELEGFIHLTNCSVDGFGSGASGTVLAVNGEHTSSIPFQNIMVDNAAYFEITGQNVVMGNGLLLQIEGSGLVLEGLIYRSPPKANDDSFIVGQILGQKSLATIFVFGGSGWYFQGSLRGLVIRNVGIFTTRTVFDEFGKATASIPRDALIAIEQKNTTLALFDFGGGKSHEVRGFRSLSPSAVSCVSLSDGAKIAGSSERITFTDNTLAALKVGLGGVVSGGGEFLDGGSNTDVGIEVNGSGAQVTIAAATTVTGTVGNVRMPDGTIRTYANINAVGPIIGIDGFNRVERL